MTDSPRYVGYLSPPYNVILTDDSGASLNLTGTSPGTDFTFTLQNMSSPLVIKHGAGTWTITDAVNGKASYQYATSDLNTAGNWQRYVSVQFPGEVSPREFDPDVLVILDDPIYG